MKPTRIDPFREKVYNDYRTRRPYNKKLANQTVDLTISQKDYAIHLPASIEIPFAVKRHGMNEAPNQKCVEFMQKDNGAFYYKWMLYSEGHSKGTKHLVKKDLFIARDPDNILFMDSGGYQASQGSGKHGDMDWSHVPSVNALCHKTLTHLEDSGNYAMILDLPTFVLGMNDNIISHEQCLKQTMYNIEYFLAHREPGRTNLLNVLQGLEEKDTDEWYDAVKKFNKPETVLTEEYYYIPLAKMPNPIEPKEVLKPAKLSETSTKNEQHQFSIDEKKYKQYRVAYNKYLKEKKREPEILSTIVVIDGKKYIKAKSPWVEKFGTNTPLGDRALEGWAMSGHMVHNVDLALRQFCILYRDGGIDDRQHWVHMLGLSTMKGAVTLTAIQRKIREQPGCENFVISYDSSSASQFMQFGRMIIGAYSDPKRKVTTFTLWKPPADYGSCGSTQLIKDSLAYNDNNPPLDKELRSELKPNEVRFDTYVMNNITVGDLCFKGPTEPGNRPWDTTSNSFVFCQNVEAIIRSFQWINEMADANDPCIEYELLDFKNRIIHEIFNDPDPVGIISQYRDAIRPLFAKEIISSKCDAHHNTLNNNDLFDW